MRKLSKEKLTGHKIWLIFDGRAHMLNTDDCTVYEAFSSHNGDTLKTVQLIRNKNWKDGVIFEYDEATRDNKNYIINERRTPK